MRFEIEFKPQALKDLKRLPKAMQRRVVARIEALGDDLAGDVRRLTDYTPEYRLRVGDYRVLFELEASKVISFTASCTARMHTGERKTA